MIISSERRRLALLVGAAAAVVGALVAVHYHRAGLTLSHYDARGHLVVARRIFDSITPGWQQIGAVWLPLPHLLNALPVQVDAFYRTGASGVAISIASFALATGALFSLVLMLTGSRAAALAAAAILALNPNVLYLQATPMTEPLLMGLTLLSVSLLFAWASAAAPDCAAPQSESPDLKVGPTASLSPDLKVGPTFPPTWMVGLAFALACLTRYEAWPVTACALAGAVWARWRSGDTLRDAIRRVAMIGLYPLAAILGFLVFSRVVIGEWFVSSGFFVAENPALGHPFDAAAQILWGVRMLSGYVVTIVAVIGLVWSLLRLVVDRRAAGYAVALSLAATAALPWWAFLDGHPYRIRYMVPLLAAEAVCAGVVVALMPRYRALAALGLVGLVVLQRQPLDAGAAMVVEAQWDRPNVVVRQQVTDCLRADYRGETIMASMGSLGHYMQELSGAGFSVRDFLHEGNGDIWLLALKGPRPLVGWILVEEKAEGGDMLAKTSRENPHFFDGFTRVCDGAGLALYRRAPSAAPSTALERSQR